MAYPPEPTALHSNLMEHLHGALGHPMIPAAHKAEYAKVQSIMAALQAKMHAEQPARGAGQAEQGAGFDGSFPNRGYTAPQAPFMRALGPAEEGGGFDGTVPNRGYTSPLVALIRSHHYASPSNPMLEMLRGMGV